MTNTLQATYRNDFRSFVITFDLNTDDADFAAGGFEPSDEFIQTAYAAGGSDFTIDGETWNVSDIK